MSDNPKQSLIDILSKVIPNVDRVIVVPDEKEKMTRAGVARPMTAKGEDETEVGTVVAVGGNYVSEYGTTLAMRYKVGDRILMDRHAGVRFRMNKEGQFLPQSFDVRDELLPVRVLRQDAILMILPTNWPL